MDTQQQDAADHFGTAALGVNLETGQEGFASVGWRDGHPHLFGAVTRPHLDSEGNETGDSTTLDGDPEFA